MAIQPSFIRATGLANEQGIAVMGILLVMLMVTALGIASLTYTGLENRMAGFASTSEAAAVAAESCIGTGVNIILQTIDQRQIPAAYVGGTGAVPSNAEDTSVPPTLTQEIMGQADNHPDTPIGAGAAPDIQATLGPFTIAGDIDRLYIKQKAGGSLQFAAGYEGTAQSAAGGGAEAYYQVDCNATNIATGTASRIVAVYACTGAAGESCQRKI